MDPATGVESTCHEWVLEMQRGLKNEGIEVDPNSIHCSTQQDG